MLLKEDVFRQTHLPDKEDCSEDGPLSMSDAGSLPLGRTWGAEFRIYLDPSRNL